MSIWPGEEKEEHRLNAPQAVRDNFPIFSYEDYDFSFPGIGFPIGLKSTYPEEFVRRIAAAAISYQMQYSRIDYTYNTYLKDKSYDMEDGSRLDLRMARSVQSACSLIEKLLHSLPPPQGRRSGEFISEWTFLRTPFSVRFLLSCSQKGVIFEAVAIARILLEQIAWAVEISRLDDLSAIQKTDATRTVGKLNAIVPVAGRLYGWLSDHAHWAYGAHIKAMDFRDGRTASVFASSSFKMRALLLTGLMSQLAVKSLWETNRHLLVASDIFSQVQKIDEAIRDSSKAILECDPADTDSIQLSGMLTSITFEA